MIVYTKSLALPLITHSRSPLRGSGNQTNLTQGSQSLALGLTMTAAPQLVEGFFNVVVAAKDP
jgi:hypothetical protein